MSIQALHISQASSCAFLLEKEVEAVLNQTTVQTIQHLAEDHFNRKNYQHNLQLLSEGIFYPIEYYQALKNKNQTQRLEFFTKKGSFWHGFAASKSVKMVDDAALPTGKKIGCFVLENKAVPSSALEGLKKGLSLFGCGEVVQLSQYTGILEVLGQEKFDALFAYDSSTPFMIGSTLPNNPISRLRRYLMKENPQPSDFRIGDVVYISNAATYLAKHPTGHETGCNMLCIDNSPGSLKFTGLGLSPKGNTIAEVENELLEAYNTSYQKPPFNLTTQEAVQAYERCFSPARIASMERLKDSIMSYEEFKAKGGGTLKIVAELDVPRLTALANHHLAEARVLLDGYDVRKTERYHL